MPDRVWLAEHHAKSTSPVYHTSPTCWVVIQSATTRVPLSEARDDHGYRPCRHCPE